MASGTAQNPNYINLYDESGLTFAGRTQIGAGVAIEHGNPVNTGRLTVTATAKNPTTIDAAGLVNRGTLELARGVLRVDNDVQQKAGSLTVAGTARLVEVGSSSVLRVQGGQLRGDGSIAGTVAVTGGQVAPGNGGHDIGTLAISGDYSQSRRGGAALDAGRHSGDLIRVGGQARLGGMLDVDNAFRPSAETTRTLLSAHTLTGRLACIITTGNGATGQGARHWVTALVGNRLTIKSVAGRRTSC